MDGLFISGAGTGVGKTLVTSILCWQLRRAGRAVAAIKPVVSGFREDDAESDPAVILRDRKTVFAGGRRRDFALAVFSLPASPHLAARRGGRRAERRGCSRFLPRVGGPGGSVLLIEGAGGIMYPAR